MTKAHFLFLFVTFMGGNSTPSWAGLPITVNSNNVPSATSPFTIRDYPASDPTGGYRICKAQATWNGSFKDFRFTYNLGFSSEHLNDPSHIVFVFIALKHDPTPLNKNDNHFDEWWYYVDKRDSIGNIDYRKFVKFDQTLSKLGINYSPSQPFDEFNVVPKEGEFIDISGMKGSGEIWVGYGFGAPIRFEDSAWLGAFQEMLAAKRYEMVWQVDFDGDKFSNHNNALASRICIVWKSLFVTDTPEI